MSVTFSGIKDGIVSGVGSACTTVKNAVVWSGRKISSGFNSYIVPAVKTAWEGTKKGAEKTVAFFRTGYGLGSVAAVTSIGLGIAAASLDGSENRWFRVGLIGGAVVAAGAAGYLFAKGPAVLI